MQVASSSWSAADLERKLAVWEGKRAALAGNRPVAWGMLQPPSTRYHELGPADLSTWAADSAAASQSSLCQRTGTIAGQLQREIDRCCCFLSVVNFLAFKRAEERQMHLLAQRLFPHPQNAREVLVYFVPPRSIPAYDEFPVETALPGEMWVVVSDALAGTAGSEGIVALRLTCRTLYRWLAGT